MTWAKIDDQLHAHPKVQRAWHQHRASIGLHVLALSHCAGYLTDGQVSEEFVRTQLPGAAERRRALDALLSAGLWERNGHGWLIHDYHDFNETREAVLARRPSRAGARAPADARTRAPAPGRVPTPTPTPYPYPSAS